MASQTPQLASGVGQLTSGMGTLNDGLGNYTNGVRQLNSGLSNFSNGLATYTNGVRYFIRRSGSIQVVNLLPFEMGFLPVECGIQTLSSQQASTKSTPACD